MTRVAGEAGCEVGHATFAGEQDPVIIYDTDKQVLLRRCGDDRGGRGG